MVAFRAMMRSTPVVLYCERAIVLVLFWLSFSCCSETFRVRLVLYLGRIMLVQIYCPPTLFGVTCLMHLLVHGVILESAIKITILCVSSCSLSQLASFNRPSFLKAWRPRWLTTVVESRRLTVAPACTKLSYRLSLNFKIGTCDETGNKQTVRRFWSDLCEYVEPLSDFSAIMRAIVSIISG